LILLGEFEMAQLVEIHSKAQSNNFSPDAIQQFEQWISTEIENALASRNVLEQTWRECMRLYEGVPKFPFKDWPIENAPNFEVTLGAIYSDVQYAQMIDAIFSADPFITVRSVPKSDGLLAEDAEKNKKAMQRWVDWMVANELDVKQASDDSILDDIQLGSGALYVPFVENVKKTKTRKVLSFGPKIRSLPIENLICPPSITRSLQEMKWIGIRFWLTEQELMGRAKANKWELGENNERVAKAGNIDWVRQRRETLGRAASSVGYDYLYEIIEVYSLFDIDEDGIAEDLFCVYDRTSRKVLKLAYNPYDRRPIEEMFYQKRAHVFGGIGILEMIKPFQESATELYNQWILAAIINNCKHYFAKHGSVPENMRIFPNKVTFCSDPKNDIEVADMGREYTGVAQALATTVSMSERRVGVNDMNTPRPSQVLGSRTPGITALTMMQQVSKRFTPAFDDVRKCLGNAVKQALYRYQERIMAGEQRVLQHVLDVLGADDGARVCMMLSDPKFDENVPMELTASSAAQNKMQERQDHIMLLNTLAQYYQRAVELVMLAAQPTTPPEVAEVAKKIAHSTGELVDRALRTFDSIRDPATFVIEMDKEIDSLQVNKGVLQSLVQMIQSMGAGVGGEGGNGGGEGEGQAQGGGGGIAEALSALLGGGGGGEVEGEEPNKNPTKEGD